ncbi:MAG: dependent oxidoreductase [Herminiimonas sp.]|nr:dependent oxidoreductase [Herminiimonas sp.]
MQTRYDAIVIGAGPAGSSAAILLAQAGWSVAILEKQCYPRRKVCGECIAASNLPLLEELGVGTMFDVLAGPELRHVELMCADHSIRAELPPQSHGRHRWGRALGRDRFDALLLDRARESGATVLQPWEAHAVRGRPGAFQCDAGTVGSDTHAVLTARVLIAAHGSWELAPMADGAQRRLQRASDLFAFKANFHEAALADGLLPILAFPGGYGGMVVSNSGMTTLACCIRRDRLTACRKEMRGRRAGDAVEVYLKQSCAGVRHALAGARRQGAWLSVGPIRPGIRMPDDGGDVFLVGNAAGEAHPIIGEGISMAMQSSWLLCERLIADGATILAGGAQRQIQRGYADAWRRNFAPRIHLAALFSHLAMRPAMASVLLPVLRCWPAALTHAARLSGKVKRAVDPQTCRAAALP